MINIYAGFYRCYDGMRRSYTVPIAVTADSEENAKRFLLQRAIDDFPPINGFFDHDASVSKVSEEQLYIAMKYRR